MKSPSVPPRPLVLAALALGLLPSSAGALAQVVDSFIPPMDEIGTEKEEDTREKTYVQKTALRWELSRRYSEHVIEEYLPKFEAIVRRKPGTSDSTDWKTLGRQLFVSWEESRKHQKTGTAPSDQSEWEAQHAKFLGSVASGGVRLMDWRDGVATQTALFQKEADEAPGRFQEIRSRMAESDPIWSKAIEIAAGASGATWSRAQLKEAQDAYAELKGKRDLVASTYQAIQRAYEYATKEKGEKPKTDYDSHEEATVKSWKTAVSSLPLVQKIYTQPVQDWAKALEAAYDADVKAWEAMQKAFEPVKKGEIRASSPYKDCPWDSKPEECVQKSLEALATAIAGAGRKVEGAEAKIAEDKALAEKEYRRILELNRLKGPDEERRLQLEYSRARTDDEAAEVNRKIREFRASAKKYDEEIAKIRAEHRARRKALGITPEDWAN